MFRRHAEWPRVADAVIEAVELLQLWSAWKSGR